MYADQVTRSMQETIDETNYRREKQLKYNEEHHIVPRQIYKSTDAALTQDTSKRMWRKNTSIWLPTPVVAYMSKPRLKNDQNQGCLQKSSQRTRLHRSSPPAG